jgi:hypothetical protein
MTHDPRTNGGNGGPMDGGSVDAAQQQRYDAALGQGEQQARVWPPGAEEAAVAAIHRAAAPAEAMPASVMARLSATIEQSAAPAGPSAIAPHATLPHVSGSRRSWLPWGLAAAAGIALATTAVVMNRAIEQRERQLADARAQLVAMEQRVSDNQTLLAEARARVSEVEGQARAAAERELALAQRLADATAARATSDERLKEAEMRIAAFEAPVDPAELQQNRTKLLEVPGTVRLAWKPFDIEGSPAEQRNLRGDVVWNDELQTGYLRFEGLAVNDPNVEQYQVWVIDERGLEQKVSGGVFNATAQGEVIVPIKPGIDVGRVALFAITVEKPGGTWVPDLKRRVVVAPRDS